MSASYRPNPQGCYVAPEVWAFACNVCRQPVELRRGYGIGVVFERGGDSEHVHDDGDPMLPAVPVAGSPSR